MTDRYFIKFPVITYANNQVRNITERCSILHSKLIGPNSRYTVQIGGIDNVATRADVVANTLIGDPYRDWMIWMNNNVLDPYYDWYLPDDQFFAYINDKYGSIPIAEQRIEYYRTQWPIDQTQSRVPVAVYNANLPAGWQKYFQPVYGDGGSIMYYQLGYYDWRMSTNQMISYTLTGNTFALGNTVQFTSGPNVVGQGQVEYCNSSVLVVQHVSGNAASTPLGVVDMFNANTVGTVSNANTFQINIPVTESVFWEGVTSYVMEDEARAYRRFINTIDTGTAQQLSVTINNLLQAGSGQA